ncbi:hypothetical protein F4780DRAFT_776615 [Xylariomycetidae sp. FL0641]|nr:hypothetical protein F4780DRAFT_776615 [Xylariomycetidae sp. FL0641]
MDSLRRQLGETQESLTKREKAFRSLHQRFMRVLAENEKLGGSLYKELGPVRNPSFPQVVVQDSIFDISCDVDILDEAPSEPGTGADTGSRPGAGAAGAAGACAASGAASAGQTVTISRRRKDFIDNVYARMRSDLEEAHRELRATKQETQQIHDTLNSLQRQLKQNLQQHPSTTIRLPSAPPPAKPAEALRDDAQAAARWGALRDRIAQLTTTYFGSGGGGGVDASRVPAEARAEFALLSGRWEAYLAADGQLTRFFLRALVWRYLLVFLTTPGRVYGQQCRDAVRALDHAVAVAADRLLAADYTLPSPAHAWRLHTSLLLHEYAPVDQGEVARLTEKLFGRLWPMTPFYVAPTPTSSSSDTAMEGAKDTSTPAPETHEAAMALRQALQEIAQAGAELAADIWRSRYFVLMQEKPNSEVIHDFRARSDMVTVRGRLGDGDLVDLMVTPMLVHWDPLYRCVQKAEVITR